MNEREIEEILDSNLSNQTKAKLIKQLETEEKEKEEQVLCEEK